MKEYEKMRFCLNPGDLSQGTIVSESFKISFKEILPSRVLSDFASSKISRGGPLLHMLPTFKSQFGYLRYAEDLYK